MDSEQLYLQKSDEGYKFVVQKFDELRIPVHEEFMLKEAAIVILYPDGVIDAVPVTNGVRWHLDYCKILVTKSERFASLIRYFPENWQSEYKMTKTNMVMNKMGIVVMQNIDIDNLPEEYASREEFYSMFLGYGVSNPEDALQDNLDTIIDNYPNKRCLYSKFNADINDYDGEELIKKEERRKK